MDGFEEVQRDVRKRDIVARLGPDTALNNHMCYLRQPGRRQLYTVMTKRAEPESMIPLDMRSWKFLGAGSRLDLKDHVNPDLDQIIESALQSGPTSYLVLCPDIGHQWAVLQFQG